MTSNTAMDPTVKLQKIQQIIVLLDSLTGLSGVIDLPMDDLRWIVQLASTIESEELLSQYIIEVATTVNEIQKRASETTKKIQKINRNFSEDIEIYTDSKQWHSLLNAIS